MLPVTAYLCFAHYLELLTLTRVLTAVVNGLFLFDKKSLGCRIYLLCAVLRALIEIRICIWNCLMVPKCQLYKRGIRGWFQRQLRWYLSLSCKLIKAFWHEFRYACLPLGYFNASLRGNCSVVQFLSLGLSIGSTEWVGGKNLKWFLAKRQLWLEFFYVKKRGQRRIRQVKAIPATLSSVCDTWIVIFLEIVKVVGRCRKRRAEWINFFTFIY